MNIFETKIFKEDTNPPTHQHFQSKKFTSNEVNKTNKKANKNQSDRNKSKKKKKNKKKTSDTEIHVAFNI